MICSHFGTRKTLDWNLVQSLLKRWGWHNNDGRRVSLINGFKHLPVLKAASADSLIDCRQTPWCLSEIELLCLVRNKSTILIKDCRVVMEPVATSLLAVLLAYCRANGFIKWKKGWAPSIYMDRRFFLFYLMKRIPASPNSNSILPSLTPLTIYHLIQQFSFNFLLLLLLLLCL